MIARIGRSSGLRKRPLRAIRWIARGLAAWIDQGVDQGVDVVGAQDHRPGGGQVFETGDFEAPVEDARRQPAKAIQPRCSQVEETFAAFMCWYYVPMSVHGHYWTVAPLLAYRLRPRRRRPGEPFRLLRRDEDGHELPLSGFLTRGDPRRLLILVHGLGGSAESPTCGVPAGWRTPAACRCCG